MPILPTLDLSNLPSSENERFEFKSSLLDIKALKGELFRAASGFSNSGGGIFIAGVDRAGKPDGGIPVAIGRQSIRDWVDQIVLLVPQVRYAVRQFDHDPASPLLISQNNCVVAVEFEESRHPPHMAPDNRYYIRAGAHTLPAPHYIVEALWSRRGLTRPELVHTFRFKPEDSAIIQLGVVALTDAPALDVSISLDPLPEIWKDVKDPFPRVLPLLDRSNPFYLDLTTYHAAAQRVGPGVELRVTYRDVASNRFNYTAPVHASKAVPPWRFSKPEAAERIAKSLESIDRNLQVDSRSSAPSRRAKLQKLPGRKRS